MTSLQWLPLLRWTGILTISLLLFGLIFIFPERWFKGRFSSSHKNRNEVDARIEKTLQVPHGPVISLFSDPRPSLLGVRSFFSPGHIFISSGMVRVLTEEDVMFLIQKEEVKLSSFLSSFRTAALWVAVLFYRMTPRAWRNLEGSGSRSAYSFLIAVVCLAFSEFFGNLAGMKKPKQMPDKLIWFSQVFMQGEKQPGFIPLTFL